MFSNSKNPIDENIWKKLINEADENSDGQVFFSFKK